jgi:hypothetical protein
LATSDLRTEIYERSMEKSRILESDTYEYPERLNKTDWMFTAIVFAACIALTIAGKFM